jgi:hypothetical protein
MINVYFLLLTINFIPIKFSAIILLLLI